MSELSELERFISIRIMQEDIESIFSLLQTERDSIFVMEIIPYYVLLVQACQEFIGKNFLPEPMDTDFKDIRNHIKVYADSFSKSKRRIETVDEIQDKNFKEQLHNEALKRMDAHLNLGSYWTDDKHIIGNTQQLADFLGIDNIFDPNLSKKQYQIGYEIGSFVASIRDGFANSFSYPDIRRKCISIKTKYYFDINTNRDNELFTDMIPKELNLFFLHLLCNMNFVKHVLSPLFADENTWVFRIEYIVSYYTLRALERLKNYCENNNEIFVEAKDVADILARGEKIFKTELRNCMMHYNLENAKVISFENINKPFYGIIENCFDGTSYQDYLVSLHDLSNMIINYLEDKFDFSNVKLEEL